MSKKKIILAFAILATFILVMVLVLIALEREPSEEVILEEKKEDAIQGAELKTTNSKGFVNASIVSKPEEHFQITYQEQVDRFDIIIQTGGRNSEHFLTENEVKTARNRAETYFVENVLNGISNEAACSLNVFVSTSGYGSYTIKPSPLSFCSSS
ncbi:MAG: hypothetical protein R3346_00975 [Candidatus Spechtbacterales bacterium]|nr:hypothetical protein [Candidatus Spechtbacterales bacterium]